MIRGMPNFPLSTGPCGPFHSRSPGRYDQPSCRGVSPRRQTVAVTSPRLPTYGTLGGPESRASQVIPPRISHPPHPTIPRCPS